MTQKHLFQLIIKFIGLLSLTIGLVATVMAQTGGVKVVITQVDSSAYPLVVVQTTVKDAQGLPLTNLDASNFQIITPPAPPDSGLPPLSPPLIQGGTGGVLVAVDNNPMSGQAILLALDVSMGESELSQMKVAATALVKQLGQNDVMGLLMFDEQIHNETVQFTANQADLLKAIDDLKAVSAARTMLYEAAVEATKATAAVSLNQKQRTVIMLTNIGDNVNKLSLDDAISQTQVTHVPLYIVGFSDRAISNRASLDKLAQATGGQAMLINEATDLATTLQWLQVVLRQSYRLTFRATAKINALDPRFTVKVTTIAGDSGEAQGAFTPQAHPVTVTLQGLSPDEVVINSLNLVSQIQAAAPVMTVSYQLDDQPAVEVTAAPYNFFLDTPRMAFGAHQLTVIATDQVGNVSSPLTIPFRIPEPMQVAPTLQVRLGEEVVLQSMTNTTSIPTEVEFLLDGELLGRADNNYQFHFTNADSHYPKEAGRYNITVRTQDSLKQAGQGTIILEFMSAARTLTVPSWRMGACLVVNFIILLALMIWWLIWRRPAGTTFELLPPLTLLNTGNTSSRYELTAQVVGQFSPLNFQFGQVGAMSQAMPQPQNQPMMPAPTPPPSPLTQGGQRGVAESGASSARDRQPTQTDMKATALDGAGTLKQGLGCASQLADMVIGVLSLLAIIPVFGRPFLAMAADLQRQKSQAQFMIDMPGQVAKQFQGQAQTLRGGVSGVAAPTMTALNQSPALAAQTPMPAVSSAPVTHYVTTSPRPAAPSPITQTGDSVINWQAPPFQTTVIEPQSALILHLRVAPVKPLLRSATCLIEVQSRPIGDDTGLLNQTQSVEVAQQEIHLGGTSILRRIASFVTWLTLLLVIATNTFVVYRYWEMFWTVIALPERLSAMYPF